MPRSHISSTPGCVLTKASPTPRPANTKQEPSPSTRSPRLPHLDHNPQRLPFLFAYVCCISLNAHCTTAFDEAVRIRPCVPLAPQDSLTMLESKLNSRNPRHDPHFCSSRPSHRSPCVHDLSLECPLCGPSPGLRQEVYEPESNTSGKSQTTSWGTLATIMRLRASISWQVGTKVSKASSKQESRSRPLTLLMSGSSSQHPKFNLICELRGTTQSTCSFILFYFFHFHVWVCGMHVCVCVYTGVW